MGKRWVSILSERGGHLRMVDNKGDYYSVNIRTGTCRDLKTGECSVLPKEDIAQITDLLFGC